MTSTQSAHEENGNPRRARLAMIGVGHVASHQLRALALSPHWELVGAADTRRERRDLLPAGVPFFPSADRLLGDVDADLVLVSTPTHTHYEVGVRVLSSGHNVLIEKPCCGSSDELEALARLAGSRQLLCCVAMHAAHARDLTWLRENRAELDLGVLTGFHCSFFDPYVKDGRLLPRARSLGGSWMDSGINALSVVASVIDAGTLRVNAARHSSDEIEGCGDAAASVNFRFPNGGIDCRGSIDTDWTLGVDRKATVLEYAGSRTRVLLDHSNEFVHVLRSSRTVRVAPAISVVPGAGTGR